MNEARELFPWKQLMRFGFGVLRLDSETFWGLSLPELNAAIEVHFQKTEKPISREWLEQIMLDHPDSPHTQK